MQTDNLRKLSGCSVSLSQLEDCLSLLQSVI